MEGTHFVLWMQKVCIRSCGEPEGDLACEGIMSSRYTAWPNHRPESTGSGIVSGPRIGAVAAEWPLSTSGRSHLAV